VTVTTPVERVAQVLEAARFRRMPSPLGIAGLQIEVPGAFLGSEPSPDLVIVCDTVAQTTRQLQQTKEGVCRALDMMSSRRPLTLVLVGPRPDSAALRALSRYARVLPVGEVADDATLQNWLAVLLPLRLPEPDEARGETASLQLLEKTDDDPIARDLVAWAREGEAAVAERLHALVDEPFASDGSEPGEGASL
jgi:hypothetical protein